MSTTALFVEILIIGAISEIWIGLLFFGIASPNFPQISIWTDFLNKSPSLLLVPYLSITYSLGWLINFLAERTMKPFFQRKFRDQLFKTINENYYNVRGLFFQKASTDIIQDLRFDRHIIRISRSNIINFLLIAIGLLFNSRQFSLRIIVFSCCLSVLFSIGSFFQWTTRYKSCYSKILDTYKIIKGEYNRSLSED